MKHNKLIVVIGPTAIGKTALSIALAKHFHTEIISCDSRQFYREMQIGTAVPSEDELSAVKHHFIQSRSIFDNYTVGSFERDALHLLDGLFKEHPFVVMAGGSGLYVDAVTKGLDDFPEVDPKLRAELKNELEVKGKESLQLTLKQLDEASYKSIDINNKQRLIRALEICKGTGKPYSQFLGLHSKKRNFEVIKIGITANREVVYDRINKRVDMMMEDGLLEEAKHLYAHRDLNALQTVGYRELFDHFEGLISLEEAVAEIKKNTRRFAKRQGTWFRRDKEIKWFGIETDKQEILRYIEES